MEEVKFIDTIICPKCDNKQDSEILFVTDIDGVPYPNYCANCERCGYHIKSENWNAESVKMLVNGKVKINEHLTQVGFTSNHFYFIIGGIIGLAISYYFFFNNL